MTVQGINNDTYKTDNQRFVHPFQVPNNIVLSDGHDQPGACISL